jgi:hypothetical protein
LVTEIEIKMVSKIKMIFVQIHQVYLNSKDVLILMVMVFQIKTINVQKLLVQLKTTVVLGQIQMVTVLSIKMMLVLQLQVLLKTKVVLGQIQTVTVS